MKHKIPEHINGILHQLQTAGFESYLVGGAVRDLLLDLDPKDFDLSTSATPEQIRHVLGRRRSRIIGKRFRLVHYSHGNEIVEISTFRKKPEARPPESASHPKSNIIFNDNEFGSAYEDSWRRDFTVNSIFYDPISEKIHDFTGQGLDDLKNALVRVIGDPDERLCEDPVRILRALKLKGQYGFTLEAQTSESISRHMHLIRECSHSRLSLELQKILQKPFSDKILRAFQSHGFLRHYLPFLASKWGSPECEYMLSLLAERNRRVSAGLYRDSASLALSAAALPYIEAKFGAIGNLWENYYGIDSEIFKFLSRLIAPCVFPRVLMASSARTLLVQPLLRSMSQREKLRDTHKYAHARELITIQNDILWKSEELESYIEQFS